LTGVEEGTLINRFLFGVNIRENKKTKNKKQKTKKNSKYRVS